MYKKTKQLETNILQLKTFIINLIFSYTQEKNFEYDNKEGIKILITGDNILINNESVLDSISIESAFDIFKLVDTSVVETNKVS